MRLQSHTLSNVLHIEGDASAKQELLNDFTSQLIRLHKSTYAIPPESLHQGIYDTFDALRAYTPGFTIHLIRVFTIPSTHYVHKHPDLRSNSPGYLRYLRRITCINNHTSGFTIHSIRVSIGTLDRLSPPPC